MLKFESLQWPMTNDQFDLRWEILEATGRFEISPRVPQSSVDVMHGPIDCCPPPHMVNHTVTAHTLLGSGHTWFKSKFIEILLSLFAITDLTSVAYAHSAILHGHQDKPQYHRTTYSWWTNILWTLNLIVKSSASVTLLTWSERSPSWPQQNCGPNQTQPNSALSSTFCFFSFFLLLDFLLSIGAKQLEWISMYTTLSFMYRSPATWGSWYKPSTSRRTNPTKHPTAHSRIGW